MAGTSQASAVAQVADIGRLKGRDMEASSVRSDTDNESPAGIGGAF